MAVAGLTLAFPRPPRPHCPLMLSVQASWSPWLFFSRSDSTSNTLFPPQKQLNLGTFHTLHSRGCEAHGLTAGRDRPAYVRAALVSGFSDGVAAVAELRAGGPDSQTGRFVRTLARSEAAAPTGARPVGLCRGSDPELCSSASERGLCSSNPLRCLVCRRASREAEESPLFSWPALPLGDF